jgi:hypothetical protein
VELFRFPLHAFVSLRRASCIPLVRTTPYGRFWVTTGTVREIGKSVEPSVAKRCFQSLPQRHDFLVHGAVSRWLAAFSNCLLMSVNSVFLDLSCLDLRDAQVPQEGDQVNARPPVLAIHVLQVALSLRDDVVLAQILFRHLAKGLFAFDLSSAEFPRSCRYQSSAISLALERLSSLVLVRRFLPAK